MSERKEHHWLSSWLLPLGACLLLAAASRSPSMAADPARLDVNWRVERGDYAYRLRGRYSIASLDDSFVTSLSNDATPGATASSIEVPSGLYRVTLEPGYTLERFGAGGPAGELVPASLVSPNPVVILAKEGRIAPLGLSLVDMPGTAAEAEETCMNGS